MSGVKAFREQCWSVVGFFLCLIFIVARANPAKPPVKGSCNVTFSDLKSGFFASPGFPNLDYTSDLRCTYKVIVPIGNLIAYQSEYFSLELQDNDHCYDRLEIYRGGSRGGKSDTYCGQDVIYPSSTYGNILIIDFYTDDSVSDGGFALSWKVLDLAKLDPSFNCSFDDNVALCPGWSQSTEFDDFNWSFDRAKTTSRYAGPYFDHTTKTAAGRFAYIEASGNQPGNKAHLISPSIPKRKEHCLSLWYRIQRDGDGELTLYRVFSSGVWKTIFRSREKTDDEWTKVKVSIPSFDAQTQIVCEAKIGHSNVSAVAIDDVMLQPGLCEKMETTAETESLVDITDAWYFYTDDNCSDEEYMCNDQSYCVPGSYLCDGRHDCGDGSDENFCAPSCPENMVWEACASKCEHKCTDGPVVPECVATCVPRCTCLPGRPVRHENRCIPYAECPVETRNQVTLRQARQEVHTVVAELFQKLSGFVHGLQHL